MFSFPILWKCILINEISEFTFSLVSGSVWPTEILTEWTAEWVRIFTSPLPHFGNLSSDQNDPLHFTFFRFQVSLILDGWIVPYDPHLKLFRFWNDMFPSEILIVNHNFSMGYSVPSCYILQNVAYNEKEALNITWLI